MNDTENVAALKRRIKELELEKRIAVLEKELAELKGATPIVIPPPVHPPRPCPQPEERPWWIPRYPPHWA